MRLKIARNARIISITLLFLFGLMHVYVKESILLRPKLKFQHQKNSTRFYIEEKTNTEIPLDTMKYILMWTDPRNLPQMYMGEGQKGFIEQKCPHRNCYVTGNRSLLPDHSKFDALIFNGPEIFFYLKRELPLKRSPRQKYVFVSFEPAYEYPICAGKYKNFFNWTWTYRLDSDIKLGHLVARLKGQVVGPDVEMHWIKHKAMDPVSEKLKNALMSKTDAAIWLVSHCDTMSHREDFARALAAKLDQQYDMGLDVYGKCSGKQYPVEGVPAKTIKENYYFYLAFEKTFSEDYVTEKILTAFRNNAVPVVYGGANYSRFMPDGSYLNAKQLGVEGLAEKMTQLIKHPKDYAQFFRWRNHYSFHLRRDSVETNDYCRFCAMLNDEALVRQTTVYEDFGKWWSPPNRCQDEDVVELLKIIGFNFLTHIGINSLIDAHWIRIVEDRRKSHALGEAYVQQWTS